MRPGLVLAPPRPGLSRTASGLVGQAGDALAASRGLATLLFLSAAISLACCLLLFDADFLDGSSPFWRDPHGVVDGSWADVATALSGYDYFVRDEWRLPLFQVSRLGARRQQRPLHGQHPGGGAGRAAAVPVERARAQPVRPVDCAVPRGQRGVDDPARGAARRQEPGRDGRRHRVRAVRAGAAGTLGATPR